MLSILLVAQAAPLPPPAVAMTIIEASPADVAAYAKRGTGCGDPSASEADVVVCARMAKDPPSLATLAEIFEPKPFRPAWRMLGGEGGVRAEQRATLNGSAPALMGTFKLKF